jgi:hypothetical protein
MGIPHSLAEWSVGVHQLDFIMHLTPELKVSDCYQWVTGSGSGRRQGWCSCPLIHCIWGGFGGTDWQLLHLPGLCGDRTQCFISLSLTVPRQAWWYLHFPAPLTRLPTQILACYGTVVVLSQIFWKDLAVLTSSAGWHWLVSCLTLSHVIPFRPCTPPFVERGLLIKQAYPMHPGKDKREQKVMVQFVGSCPQIE